MTNPNPNDPAAALLAAVELLAARLESVTSRIDRLTVRCDRLAEQHINLQQRVDALADGTML